MMKLSSLVAALSLTACVLHGSAISAPGSTTQLFGGGLAGAVAGCYAGIWKGGGETPGIDNHFGFTATLTQDGSSVKGTFEFDYQMGHQGTESVIGTVDCATGVAELSGTSVSGDSAMASFKLQLKPEKQGDVETAFEGTWDCKAPCKAGVLKGYRRHQP